MAVPRSWYSQPVGAGHREDPRLVPLPHDVEHQPAASQLAGGSYVDAQQAQQEDVDMGSDQQYVFHAPVILQAPNFSGSTKQERRAFMRAYQKYVAQINALQTSGTRPFAMPLSACMDRFTKRRVALWDFGRPYDEIWENDWIRWSNGAFQEEPRDLETMKRRLESAIRFDVKILDAESRVGKMLDGLMLALECDNQEWALYDEGKDVGDLMVKAVKPSMLQTAVKKQMQLQRNKSLRTDVFRFVRWLRTFAVGYQVYGGVEDEMKPVKPTLNSGELHRS
ncbi:hypothetical protein H310_11616 [Aphanomyces invadans]|uniref:Uncharacterized protein n=1 Tax=Aphanomyces invadans TaxID=157072 RepID=A0A024TMY7_9STRA|nr:hypothetical protein H310_11616 [Aphanomyces invadans]ETV94976.1 hypothetical protein H310_11616 [Aphanomyces invadans]|eukprot:XP_008876567.1 hypothetical protein H310_11616 [Aphanomyces invadans]